MTSLISLESLPALLHGRFNSTGVHHPRLVNVAYTVLALGALYVVIQLARVARRRSKTTALRGPSNPSFVWGFAKALYTSHDSGEMFERWAEEYGGVYEIPLALGERRIVLCDPKAVAHLFGREPWTYTLTPIGRISTENFVGKGILSATGESHKRQRKALSPAFSNAAIRNLTPVFYDSACKVKGAWYSLIESNGGGSAVIEVQNWMNHISLDTIGIAGFSHHFGSLDGKPVSVTEFFDAFCSADGLDTSELFLFVLAQAFPLLSRLLMPFSKLIERWNDAMGDIANAFLTKSRKEMEAGTLGEGDENSILGILTRAENQEGKLHLTREEVVAQTKILLLAGYETTSISLTWALIELSRNLDIQTKLRAELLEFAADPTYDQLSNDLPYLDAVVHETLRLHPPLHDFVRMATVDDVIPLSKPVRTRSGTLVGHISVAKGTCLSISVPSINRSAMLWGPDARQFKPERWLKEDGIPAGAKEVQGHRHLLTFIDGPRTCLGKGFAIAEFKIVLSVLVKHFVFELVEGPETVIETVKGILPRPRVAGERGTALPLRVRRFE